MLLYILSDVKIFPILTFKYWLPIFEYIRILGNGMLEKQCVKLRRNIEVKARTYKLACFHNTFMTCKAIKQTENIVNYLNQTQNKHKYSVV